MIPMIILILIIIIIIIIIVFIFIFIIISTCAIVVTRMIHTKSTGSVLIYTFIFYLNFIKNSHFCCSL